MHPIQAQTGLADHGHQIQNGIRLPQAVMRARAENQPILARLLGGAADPPVGIEELRVRISVGIMEGEIGGRHDHGALGRGVGIREGEGFLGDVRDHDDGRPVAQGFLDDGPGEGHVVEEIDGEAAGAVAVAHGQLFGAHPGEDGGPVGEQLEEPGGGAAGGVLGREEEGEERHGDLEVGEGPEQLRRFRGRVDAVTLFELLSVRFRGLDLLDPAVEDAGDGAAGGHADFRLGRAFGEFVQDHVGRFLAVPGLREGDDEGEVDEFERGGDQEVVVGDLLDRCVRHVVPDEGAQGDGTHEFAEDGHEGDGLAVVLGLGDGDEFLEVFVVDFFLAGQVDLQGLAGEEAVEAFTVVDVGFAVKEDPVVGAEELVCYVYDTGFDEGGGIEDFAGHVSRCSNDNEPVQSSSLATGFLNSAV